MSELSRCYRVIHVFKNIAASQTDAEVVASTTGHRVRVISMIIQVGGTATNVTFNTKPSGAGTAISMTFQNAANGGVALGRNEDGWFQTSIGEGLSVTTGTGSTTGMQIVYVLSQD